ncbi:MAG: sulfotransferase [Acidimicrobiales bacterium]
MKTKQTHRRPSVARVVDRVRALPVFRSYPTLYVGSAIKARRHRDELAPVRTFVMFVGHPRSGHSLVGSLLDAHPNMAVAHELDVLKYVAAGYRRDQLLTLVLEHSRTNADTGRKSWGYSYAVPGQWQGRYQRLEVAGDKRGRKSTARLRDHPELFDRLVGAVDMPVKVIQVVRHPYDNIATMFKRGSAPIEHQIDLYFELSETVDRLVGQLPADRFERAHLEDLIADTASELARLCRFLDVPAEPDYLAACAGIVFASPRRTRDEAQWTPELRASVERGIAEHEWLTRYSFES